ncbi:MAG TPA: sodium:calcium antiporter [Chloroflexota bacterium]|nr:sodium:calcium antiporter [Chloroflexota bacterium]
MWTAVLLTCSLGLIFVASGLFTNSVEWVGHKLELNEGVVGSVLAAIGTAMPETLIPIVAILWVGEEYGDAVGIGAILGAPFMLATLAMFVTGLSVTAFAWTGRRTRELRVNASVLGRDNRFFFLAYVLAIGAAFLPLHGIKVALAVFVLGLYVFYVYKHATDEAEQLVSDTEDMSPLHFHRASEDPRLLLVVAQLAFSLAIMIGGAYLFVEQVNAFASANGVPALLLSLLIAPVATELPECMNSVIWVRQGKDTLALGNITGAMVFQSCIPVAVGLAFGDWTVTPDKVSAFVSAGIAVLAAGLIFGTLSFGQRKLTSTALLSGGVFYLLYVGYLVASVIQQT